MNSFSRILKTESAAPHAGFFLKSLYRSRSTFIVLDHGFEHSYLDFQRRLCLQRRQNGISDQRCRSCYLNDHFTARYFQLQISEGNYVDRSKAVSHSHGISTSRRAPRQPPRRHPNPKSKCARKYLFRYLRQLQFGESHAT